MRTRAEGKEVADEFLFLFFLLMVELDDLEGFLQPRCFYGSMILSKSISNYNKFN